MIMGDKRMYVHTAGEERRNGESQLITIYPAIFLGCQSEPVLDLFCEKTNLSPDKKFSQPYKHLSTSCVTIKKTKCTVFLNL